MFVNGFKIPNVAIAGNKDGLSWLSALNDIKLIKVLIYLYNNQVISSNDVRFTLSDMIISCGYKLNRNKGCINDKFKLLLNSLRELGAIECDVGFDNIKPNDFISVKYSAISVDLEGKDIYYTYCPYTAFDKMMLYTEDNIDNYYLVLVYLYIASKINPNTDIKINGGKAEVCWFTYETVCNDLSISNSVYSKYISILKKLKLIDYANIGRVIDKKGNMSNANNVYVLTSTEDYKYHLKQGLKESQFYYEDTLGWTIK